MEEDQSKGQLIVAYTVEVQAGTAAAWKPFSSGYTVGAKRIDIAEGGGVSGVTALKLTVTHGFGAPTGLKLFAFAPEPCAQAPFEYAV